MIRYLRGLSAVMAAYVERYPMCGAYGKWGLVSRCAAAVLKSYYINMTCIYKCGRCIDLYDLSVYLRRLWAVGAASPGARAERRSAGRRIYPVL